MRSYAFFHAESATPIEISAKYENGVIALHLHAENELGLFLTPDRASEVVLRLARAVDAAEREKAAAVLAEVEP